MKFTICFVLAGFLFSFYSSSAIADPRVIAYMHNKCVKTFEAMAFEKQDKVKAVLESKEVYQNASKSSGMKEDEFDGFIKLMTSGVTGMQSFCTCATQASYSRYSTKLKSYMLKVATGQNLSPSEQKEYVQLVTPQLSAAMSDFVGCVK